MAAAGFNAHDYVSQWISSVVDVNRESNDDQALLKRIIGPPTVNIDSQSDNKSKQMVRSVSFIQDLLNDDYKHSIVVKIPEKVFVDSLDVYETACEGALVKIEVHKHDGKLFETNNFLTGLSLVLLQTSGCAFGRAPTRCQPTS
jgi:hypothetical protein